MIMYYILISLCFITSLVIYLQYSFFKNDFIFLFIYQAKYVVQYELEFSVVSQQFLRNMYYSNWANNYYVYDTYSWIYKSL